MQAPDATEQIQRIRSLIGFQVQTPHLWLRSPTGTTFEKSRQCSMKQHYIFALFL